MDGDCLVDLPRGLDRVQVGFVEKHKLMELREEISYHHSAASSVINA
tara:strand:+ start:129 stop:269 length:141 start_codon:yes stop_codon:yes gene_type:complete